MKKTNFTLKRKRILSMLMSATMCLTCVPLTSAITTSKTLAASTETTTTTTISELPAAIKQCSLKDKGIEYNQEPEDGSSSDIKPVLEVTKYIARNASEVAGKNVTIEFKLSGADKQYDTTEYRIQWDERLKVVQFRGVNAKRGAALEMADQIFAENNGANGIVVFSGAQDNERCGDGVMWTIELTVPSDAKAGDVFPIDVYYGSNNDCFRKQSDKSNSDKSLLMQAYFFTKGINSSQNPSTDPYLVAAGAAFADGYIAIDENYNPNKSLLTVPPATSTGAKITTTASTTSTSTTTKPTTTSATSTTTSKPTTTTTTSTTTTAKPTTKSTTSTTTTKPTTTSTTSTTTAKSTTKSTTSTTTAKPTTTATTSTTTAKPTTTSTTSTTISKPKATISAIMTSTVYSSGDVTGDGIIDGRDATDVLTDYAKTSTGQESRYNEEQKKAADVNNDNIIDGRDATTILTYYAKTSVGEKMTIDEFINGGTTTTTTTTTLAPLTTPVTTVSIPNNSFYDSLDYNYVVTANIQNYYYFKGVETYPTETVITEGSKVNLEGLKFRVEGAEDETTLGTDFLSGVCHKYYSVIDMDGNYADLNIPGEYIVVFSRRLTNLEKESAVVQDVDIAYRLTVVPKINNKSTTDPAEHSLQATQIAALILRNKAHFLCLKQ